MTLLVAARWTSSGHALGVLRRPPVSVDRISCSCPTCILTCTSGRDRCFWSSTRARRARCSCCSAARAAAGVVPSGHDRPSGSCWAVGAASRRARCDNLPCCALSAQHVGHSSTASKNHNIYLLGACDPAIEARQRGESAGLSWSSDSCWVVVLDVGR